MRWGCAASAVAAIVVPPLLLMKACVSDEIIARVDSPSGRFAAVVHQTNGGATTEFGYYVVVRRLGVGWYPGTRSFFVADSAVRADCEEGLDLRWRGDGNLAIGFSSATRFSRDYPHTISIDNREIVVALLPGATEPLTRCLAAWERAAAQQRRGSGTAK